MLYWRLFTHFYFYGYFPLLRIPAEATSIFPYLSSISPLCPRTSVIRFVESDQHFALQMRSYCVLQQHIRLPKLRQQFASHASPHFSLGDFLLRQRVIGLWRDIIRAIHKMPKASSTRVEMRDFAREEFERNKRVTDTTKIRYLVSTGRTQFESMRGAVDGV